MLQGSRRSDRSSNQSDSTNRSLSAEGALGTRGIAIIKTSASLEEELSGFTYSDHAVERMLKHKISSADVERVVNGPDARLPYFSASGTLEFFGFVDGEIFSVVTNADASRAITVIRDKKKQWPA